MGTEGTTPDLTPKTFRFTDIDEFRSSVRSLEVDFTPLARTISAEQTVLNLAGCDVNFTRSFPRIIDARLAPNCTTVGFTMDDGVPIRFNGAERDHAAIVIGNDGAAFSAVERTERKYAGIVFRPTVENRGWPRTGVNFQIFETSLAAQQRLRELVVQVLTVAPRLADGISAADASAAIRESLLAGVDAVFADVIPVRWTSYANSARHFKIFKDIEGVLSSNLGKPIYSEELARQVGVSVRSVHDAVRRYRGMSLHRYLRLRRLWLVRRALLGGAESIKACALAFGFWHLGDFSASYRLQFGETPSETLARARLH
jgi:AraC-like DNA-binding protein